MRFFVLSLPLLLSACAITSINDNYAQTVSSWRWAKISALEQSWGRPSQIGKLPNGNKVYIYRKEGYKNYPAPPITSNFATVSVANGRSVIIVPASSQPPPGPAYLSQCTTTFEVDPRNIIVDARASGNNCSANGGFVLSKSNPNPVTQPKPPKTQ